MVEKIDTENGKCWAIVLKNCRLEDISRFQSGLIEIMMTATGSDLFDGSKDGFLYTLSLLRECIFSETQANEYERFLKKGN